MFDVKLSVFVVTYNQEKYIRKALDSILMQHVDFSYEVIIGDDCSTDSTPSICDEYACKYSFIKVFHHKSNLGLVKNWEFVLNHCSGQYVAMLEGDDFWLDSNKLQKQVDWLEHHQDYSLTFSNIKVVYEGNDVFQENIFPTRNSREYTVSEIAKDWIVLSSSVVFRNVLCGISYPKHTFVCDTYTFLLIMTKGKAFLFPEKMTAYRRHSENITRGIKDIDYYYKWVLQYRNFAKCLPSAELKRLSRRNESLWLESIIWRESTPLVSRCRWRYIWLNPSLIFSSFFIQTIKHYSLLKFLFN